MKCLTPAIVACLVVCLGVHSARGAAVNLFNHEGDPSQTEPDHSDCGLDGLEKHTEQSPINIKTDDVVLNPVPQKFVGGNWDSSEGQHLNMSHVKLINTGHTIKVALSGTKPTIAGGGLPEMYVLEQFHFHWGLDENLSHGSEHLVNSYRYPMEVHFVHWASSRGSMGEAVDKPMGLAVIGFFIDVGETHNPHFDVITDNLQYVRHETEYVELDPIAIETLLPEQSQEVMSNEYAYWRYYGSLTTGDEGKDEFLESVIWTVFKRPISISYNQWLAFRGIIGEHEEVIINNFRPLQPLCDRNVYTNRPEGLTSCHESNCNGRYPTPPHAPAPSPAAPTPEPSPPAPSPPAPSPPAPSPPAPSPPAPSPPAPSPPAPSPPAPSPPAPSPPAPSPPAPSLPAPSPPAPSSPSPPPGDGEQEPGENENEGGEHEGPEN